MLPAPHHECWCHASAHPRFWLRVQVLINIKSYPTQTDLVVITNKPDNLARWRDDGTVVAGLDFEVWGQPTSHPPAEPVACIVPALTCTDTRQLSVL